MKVKNKWIAIALAILLGTFGLHKFYLGEKGGIWYLLFCWTGITTIFAIIDIIKYVTMSDEIFKNRYCIENLKSKECMTEEAKESIENKKIIPLDDELEISNENDAIKEIVEIKNIFNKCQKFYFEKEITQFEFEKIIENIAKKMKDIKEGININIFFNDIGIIIFLFMPTIAICYLYPLFGKTTLYVMLFFVSMITLSFLVTIIYIFINKENLKKEAEAYGKTQIDEYNRKLFDIDSNLIKKIREENKKYASDNIFNNIFKNLPFLFFSYSTLKSKKCKNFSEVTYLYMQNKDTIEADINNAKNSILEKAIDIKKGNKIGGFNINAILALAVSFLIFYWIIPETIGILKLLIGGLSVILFIGFGLWKFIVKSSLKNIFQEEAENYMEENFFLCIEDTIKKHIIST